MKVESTYADNGWDFDNVWSIESEINNGYPYLINENVSSENETIQLSQFGLSNYPNPFNPTTNISFSLKEAGNVKLEVYNAKGQKIKTLVNGEMAANNHVVTWNGDDNNGKKVSSGIYFYKMHSKKYSETKKMLLMK